MNADQITDEVLEKGAEVPYINNAPDKWIYGGILMAFLRKEDILEERIHTPDAFVRQVILRPGRSGRLLKKGNSFFREKICPLFVHVAFADHCTDFGKTAQVERSMIVELFVAAQQNGLIAMFHHGAPYKRFFFVGTINTIGCVYCAR